VDFVIALITPKEGSTLVHRSCIETKIQRKDTEDTSIELNLLSPRYPSTPEEANHLNQLNLFENDEYTSHDQIPFVSHNQ